MIESMQAASDCDNSLHVEKDGLLLSMCFISSDGMLHEGDSSRLKSPHDMILLVIFVVMRIVSISIQLHVLPDGNWRR